MPEPQEIKLEDMDVKTINMDDVKVENINLNPEDVKVETINLEDAVKVNAEPTLE